MARDHARVNLDIWNDPDFRSLPLPAQHLYFVLWTHPDLTYCGSLDWRPARLSGLTEGASRHEIEQAADCLKARHFLVVDEGTEEALIRSWIKFDGLMKQPRMAISCITAYGALGSDTIRKVVVHELQKVRESLPDLPIWSDDRVARILEHPSISAKSLDTPDDPFGGGFTHGFTPTVTPSLGETETKGKGLVCTPPTPAPTPATNSIAPSASRRRKPSTPIADDWKPSQKHHEYATEHGINVGSQMMRFRNHVLAKDLRYADWDAAFRNWLVKALEYGQTDKPQQSPPPAPSLALTPKCPTCNAPQQITHYEDCSDKEWRPTA